MQEEIGGASTNSVYTNAWVFCKVKGWETGYKEASDHFMFRTAEAYLNAAEAAYLVFGFHTERDYLGNA